MYVGMGKKDMAGVSGKLGILVNFSEFWQKPTKIVGINTQKPSRK